MRVRHGLTGVEEENEPCVDVQPVFVAVGGDRSAVHVLHGEERPPVLGHPSVEQSCDVRVREARQDAPLAQEPIDQIARTRRVAHELERYALVELPVHALGEVDRAHPPAAELVQDAIGTEALPGACRLPNLGQRIHDPPGVGWIEESFRSVVGREEGLHLRPDLGAIATDGVQKRSALGDRKLHRLREERGDHLTRLRRRPSSVAHASLPSSSRWSQARASDQSRLTVRGAIPRTSHVSSTVNPAKNRHSTTRTARG